MYIGHGGIFCGLRIGPKSNTVRTKVQYGLGKNPLSKASLTITNRKLS